MSPVFYRNPPCLAQVLLGKTIENMFKLKK